MESRSTRPITPTDLERLKTLGPKLTIRSGCSGSAAFAAIIASVLAVLAAIAAVVVALVNWSLEPFVLVPATWIISFVAAWLLSMKDASHDRYVARRIRRKELRDGKAECLVFHGRSLMPLFHPKGPPPAERTATEQPLGYAVDLGADRYGIVNVADVPEHLLPLGGEIAIERLPKSGVILSITSNGSPLPLVPVRDKVWLNAMFCRTGSVLDLAAPPTEMIIE